MEKLMRRSVVMYEYKDRWDEDVDPEWESEQRVQWTQVNREEEEKVVGRWMAETE